MASSLSLSHITSLTVWGKIDVDEAHGEPARSIKVNLTAPEKLKGHITDTKQPFVVKWERPLQGEERKKVADLFLHSNPESGITIYERGDDIDASSKRAILSLNPSETQAHRYSIVLKAENDSGVVKIIFPLGELEQGKAYLKKDGAYTHVPLDTTSLTALDSIEWKQLLVSAPTSLIVSLTTSKVTISRVKPFSGDMNTARDFARYLEKNAPIETWVKGLIDTMVFFTLIGALGVQESMKSWKFLPGYLNKTEPIL